MKLVRILTDEDVISLTMTQHGCFPLCNNLKESQYSPAKVCISELALLPKASLFISPTLSHGGSGWRLGSGFNGPHSSCGASQAGCPQAGRQPLATG